MQTGTFMGGLIRLLSFGLIAAHESFTLAWSVSALAVLHGTVFLVASMRQLGRDVVVAVS